MRWDSLFEDLEAQFSAERTLARESEISERVRVELAGLDLADRLRGVAGAEIALVLSGGISLQGTLGHIGGDWFVLVVNGRQWLIPCASVSHYDGLGRLARKPASQVQSSLRLASALRGLSRDRAPVTVVLAAGPGGDQRLHGVIDRVGRDHFDFADTRGEVRRGGAVAAVRTIPFTSLAALCSSGNQGL